MFPNHCDSIGDVDVFSFVFETGHAERILQSVQYNKLRPIDLTSCRDLGNNFVAALVIIILVISKLAIIFFGC